MSTPREQFKMVSELVCAEGITHSEAYARLRGNWDGQPKSLSAPERAKKIKDAVAAVQADSPMPFIKAWGIAKAKHPELFRDEEPQKTAPTSIWPGRRAPSVIHCEEEPRDETVTFVDPRSGATLAEVPAVYLDDPWYH